MSTPPTHILQVKPKPNHAPRVKLLVCYTYSFPIHEYKSTCSNTRVSSSTVHTTNHTELLVIYWVFCCCDLFYGILFYNSCSQRHYTRIFATTDLFNDVTSNTSRGGQGGWGVRRLTEHVFTREACSQQLCPLPSSSEWKPSRKHQSAVASDRAHCHASPLMVESNLLVVWVAKTRLECNDVDVDYKNSIQIVCAMSNSTPMCIIARF